MKNNEEWMPRSVGGTNEPTDEVYVSKHGLKIRRSSDMGNTHWDIFKSLADRDPNLVSNMKAGRYMPTCNGIRTTYMGKDTWLGIKVGILNILLEPIIVMLVLTLILALIML